MTNSCTTTIPQSHKHSKSFHDFEKEEISQLRTLLLRWYDEHRRTLPWRKAFHVCPQRYIGTFF